MGPQKKGMKDVGTVEVRVREAVAGAEVPRAPALKVAPGQTR